MASPHTRYSLNSGIWGLRPGLREHGLGTAGHPLGAAETRQDVMRYGWPSPDWFDYRRLQQEAAGCSEYFVVVGGFTPLFYLIGDLRGMERGLMDMCLNPEVTVALCERIEEFYLGYFSRIAATCGGSIDAVAFGDDFASQSGPLMSPEHWRAFFKPAWTRLFAIARRAGYRVMFHSCGSMAEVIPDLIDAGLDILYPVQPKARGMEIGLLRREFGGSLSFYGGVDVQELLPFGTTQDVERDVIRIARVFGSTGGLILSTSHVIMDDVPEENVAAMYETARSIGRYL